MKNSLTILLLVLICIASTSISWTASDGLTTIETRDKDKDQNLPPKNWQWANIGASAAWNVATGNGIKIAIVDEGYDLDHQDFAGQIAFTDQPASFPAVLVSHGTHVTGCVGANGIGTNRIRSIAYNADLYLYQVSTSNNDDVYNGILQAAQDGADVINVSWGREYAPSSSQLSKLNQAAALGAIIVTPAGNNTGGTTYYPAQLPNVISVAGYDVNNLLASNFVYNSQVDLSAPAIDVYTTDSNGGYTYTTGTSLACPMVAGTVALMLEVNPCLNMAESRQILMESANTSIYNISANQGKLAGAGRLNAHGAAQLAEQFPTNYATSIQGSNAVAVTSDTQYSINLPNQYVSDVTINWTYSNNIQYKSGQGTKTLKVRSKYSGAGWVRAQITNCGGYTKTITKNVWSGKPGVPSIQGTSTIYSCYNTTRYDLSSSTISMISQSNSSLSWQVINGDDVTYSSTLPYRWIENNCSGTITIKAILTNAAGSSTGTKNVNSQGCGQSCGGVLPGPGFSTIGNPSGPRGIPGLNSKVLFDNSNEILSVELKNSRKSSQNELKIVLLNGQVVYQGRLDGSDLTAIKKQDFYAGKGLYIIRISSGNQWSSHKVMLE